jgi:hypothetical protein
VFGLFVSNKLRPTAIAIHQLCHAAQYAHETLGPKAAVGFFSNHEFKTFHRKPATPYDHHEFRLGRGLDDFRFLVSDKENMIQVFGGGDAFAGFGLTTLKQRGKYHVYVVTPLSIPVGRYAKTLARVFVRDYGARDTSELMAGRY